MIDLGKIPEEQKTPLVMELLHVIGQLMEQIERLREEVARLKEHKGKPKIPPSRLEKDPKEKPKKKDRKKRPGSKKRSILFTIEFSRFIGSECESFPLAGFAIPVNISSVFGKSFCTTA